MKRARVPIGALLASCALLSLAGLAWSNCQVEAFIPPQMDGVTTARTSNARLGVVANEATLTRAAVAVSTFGKLRSLNVDGEVYAQPLVVKNVLIGGGIHNVVYVVTMHNGVFAFDADDGHQYWTRSLGTPALHGTDYACSTFGTEVGILGTPVIDLASSTLYLVAKTNDSGTFRDKLHALDITTGASRDGSPVIIAASVAGTGNGSLGGVLSFTANPSATAQRPALLLSSGVVYIAWGTNCADVPWHGWVMGYNATTLVQTMAWATTPDASPSNVRAGGGIWNPAGLAADAAGDLYFAVGDGVFTADIGGRNYAMSAVRLSPAGIVLDWFTPDNWSALSDLDRDLNSGGVAIVGNRMILGSKGLGADGETPGNEFGSGEVYVLNLANLGHLVPGNGQIVQSWSNGTTIFSPLAHFAGALYLGDKTALRAYPVTGSTFGTTPVSAPGIFNRASPWISANGVADGIVWITQNTTSSPAVLYAFRSSDLATLWTSSQASASRDQAANAVRWATPVAYNGKVYLGGVNAVTVYGLLP